MTNLVDPKDNDPIVDIIKGLGEILENTRELLGAIFIQEQRNYDMLAIIADKLGANSVALSKIHAEGQVLAPAPSFIFEDDETTQQ